MKIKGKDQGQSITKLMFKEIGTRINFTHPKNNDYLKILKQCESLIVCEDLSRNQNGTQFFLEKNQKLQCLMLEKGLESTQIDFNQAFKASVLN